MNSKRKEVRVTPRDLSGASLSALEESILMILKNHKELYGLQISKAIESASAGRQTAGFGSLYPALRRLESKGFLRSHWDNSADDERSGARRRYYEITDLGVGLLEAINEMRASLAAWSPA